MNYENRAEVYQDLKLSEIEHSQRKGELFDYVTIDIFGMPEDLNAHNRARKAEAIAKKHREFYELEERVKDLGYKSLATAVYGLSKKIKLEQVPTRYLTAPAHLRATSKSSTRLQKQWSQDVLPLLNSLIDDSLNETDWENIDEWFNKTESIDDFVDYLLDIQHQENCGEFDLEAINVRIEQRIHNTKKRLSLLPAAPTPELKLLSGGKKPSVDLSFDPTGFTNANEHLAEQQLNALTPEERQLFESLYG